MVESPENVGELQNDLKKTFHAVVVNQRIYHVIPFVKVTFLLRHRIITRFLAAQSNRACVNYHDDRSKGGGDRTTWFHDKFFPSFRAIGEMITRRNGCESKSRKTFRPRPILSLSLSIWRTLCRLSRIFRLWRFLCRTGFIHRRRLLIIRWREIRCRKPANSHDAFFRV